MEGHDDSVVTEAGDAGDFQLLVHSAKCTLFVVHEGGTKIVPHDQYAPDVPIRLDPWASIEGTVSNLNGPMAGAKIFMNGGHFPLEGGPQVLVCSTVRTDREGKFVFERVPAHFDGQVRRLVPSNVPDRSSWGFGMGFLTSPGERESVHIAGHSVNGRIALPQPKDRLRIYAGIHTFYRVFPEPEGYAELSRADQWERYKSWFESEEGRRARRSQCFTIVTGCGVDDGGRFQIDDVPSDVPLELDLEIQPRERNWFGDLIRRLRRRPKQLKLRRELVIPSASDPYDLGVLHAQ